MFSNILEANSIISTCNFHSQNSVSFRQRGKEIQQNLDNLRSQGDDKSIQITAVFEIPKMDMKKFAFQRAVNGQYIDSLEKKTDIKKLYIGNV